MKSKLFLIFNHSLTPAQETDALEFLDVGEIMAMPPSIGRIWSDIPADAGAITNLLEPVKTWLGQNAAPDDFVLIQGDFGACFIMVSFALENGFIPVYSTTTRDAREESGPDGTIKVSRTFRHLIYRRYGR